MKLNAVDAVPPKTRRPKHLVELHETLLVLKDAPNQPFEISDHGLSDNAVQSMVSRLNKQGLEPGFAVGSLKAESRRDPSGEVHLYVTYLG